MKRSEREARAAIAEFFKQHAEKGTDFDLDGDTTYGSGRLTRHQRKSQERYIPKTPAPKTLGQKIARNLFG